MKYNALGINIFAGGFTLGVSRHFNILSQWEEISLGKKSFEYNFPKLKRYEHYSEWTPADLRGRVNLIYANPPCAPWSRANCCPGITNQTRFNDPRLMLTAHTMEAALDIHPDIFITESVENAYHIGAQYYQHWNEKFMKQGYAVTWFLTDAVLHGSPSRRRRFHFIAHKPVLKFGRLKHSKPITVRDVIWDIRHKKTFGTLPQHEERYCHPEHRRIMQYLPSGGNLYRAIAVLRKKQGYTRPSATFLNHRLHWDAVANTIIGFGIVHPGYPRWITLREGLRLATYPDTYCIHQIKDATAAVLPAVGDYLGALAKRSIQVNQSAPVEFNMIDWRGYAKDFPTATSVSKKIKYDFPNEAYWWRED